MHIMDPEKLAEQLYEALLMLLGGQTRMGLLAALGDIQSRVSFDQASPKTRTLFYELANNLTRIQAQR